MLPGQSWRFRTSITSSGNAIDPFALPLREHLNEMFDQHPVVAAA
jgi:hypothetical protein